MQVGMDSFHRVIQFFWDPEPKNTEHTQTIWCLGCEYPPVKRPAIQEGLEGEKVEGAEEVPWPPEFLDDFESRIWMTYRSEFPPIPRSTGSENMSVTTRFRSQLSSDGFTSDVGWGCMIRSAQALLANTLAELRFGRDWRTGQRQEEEKALLSLFADDPRAPFSIHNFVRHGELACGKHPGEWFGPSAAAHCIQALATRYKDSGLRVYYNAEGSDVYEDAFRKVAVVDGVFHPTLVLIGSRLGIDRVTPVYWEALKACIQMPHALGVAGGRPSSSHYFVGVQGDYLFYLDPHQSRIMLPYVPNASELSPEHLASCHTRRLRRLHMKEMDPSMLLAFLIHDQDDWEEWKTGVQEVQGKSIIHVLPHSPPAGGRPVREEAVEEVESLDEDDDEF